MKTMLFCTSYMNEGSEYNNKKRYERWMNFYCDKMGLFGSEYLFLIDDGSPVVKLEKADIIEIPDLPEMLTGNINLVRFCNNLGRSAQLDYRGWWRSFTYSIILAEKYKLDKIIHIESDFFTVSEKLIGYLKDISSGWTALYSRFHMFPETAIQIICRDAFGLFRECYDEVVGNDFKMNRSAEFYFPFTRVENGFCGDRLGQFDVLDGWLRRIKPPIELDYIGQVLPECKVSDYEPFFNFHYKWDE